MKAGILTVYNALNYGCFLQAYALKKALNELGCEAVFIRVQSDSGVVAKALKKAVLRKKFVLSRIQAVRERICILKEDLRELPVENKPEDLDLILVGSDTMWDIAKPTFQKREYYGGAEFGCPQYTYAVSCSDSTEKDFYKMQRLTENISSFQTITVRDCHTQDLVRSMWGIHAKKVCDPTLLVSKDTWKMEPVYEDLTDVLLVYTYYFSDKIKRFILNFAQKRNLKVISIGIFQEWCTGHINCHSLEFPSYLSKAAYVVTNTFHGTIFSAMFSRNFVIVENGNKVREIVFDLGIHEKFFKLDDSYDRFVKIIQSVIDCKAVQDKIEQLQEMSNGILFEILSGKEKDG